MALSGRINGKVDLNSTYFSFYILWDVTNSQADRVANNWSVVRVRAYLQTSTTARKFDTTASYDHWVQVNGQTDAWTARINCNPWPSNPYLLRTYTLTVPHEADGTKSVDISARVNATVTTYGAGICTAGATVTLDPIVRATMWTRVGGVWRNSKAVHVKVDGVWREAKEVYSKVGGAWRKGK